MTSVVRLCQHEPQVKLTITASTALVRSYVTCCAKCGKTIVVKVPAEDAA